MELKKAVLQVRDLIFGDKPLPSDVDPTTRLSAIAQDTGTDERELQNYFNNFAMLKMEVDKLDDADFERRKVERTGQLVDLAKKNWKGPSLAILNMYWDTRESQRALGDQIEDELQEILERGGIKYKRYQLNPKSVEVAGEGDTKRRGRPRTKNVTSIADRHATKNRNKKDSKTNETKKSKDKALTNKVDEIPATTNKDTNISRKEASNVFPIKNETIDTTKPRVEASKENKTPSAEKKEQPLKNDAKTQENEQKFYGAADVSIDLNNALADYKAPSELDFIQKLSAIARHCITISKMTEDQPELNQVFGQLFDGLYSTTYLASRNALKNNSIEKIISERDAARNELEMEKAKLSRVEKSFNQIASSILDLETKNDIEMLETLGTKMESWKKAIYRGGYIPEQSASNNVKVDQQGWVVKYNK